MRRVLSEPQLRFQEIVTRHSVQPLAASEASGPDEGHAIQGSGGGGVVGSPKVLPLGQDPEMVEVRRCDIEQSFAAASLAAELPHNIACTICRATKV